MLTSRTRTADTSALNSVLVLLGLVLIFDTLLELTDGVVTRDSCCERVAFLAGDPRTAMIATMTPSSFQLAGVEE